MAESLVSLTCDEIHNIWSTGFATRAEHIAFRLKLARALVAIEDRHTPAPAHLRIIHEQEQAAAAKGDARDDTAARGRDNGAAREAGDAA